MRRWIAAVAALALAGTAAGCGSSGDKDGAAMDLTVAAYFASTKLTSDDPDLVKRFTDAINESLTYAGAHPDEVRAVLGTYTKIDPKLRETLTLPKWPATINQASVGTLAELGKQDGIFGTATPDLTKILP